MLLLDGQQRTTSLFLVLKSGKPVPTRDARGKALQRRYFIDMSTAIDPTADREDAVLSTPADGVLKTFGGEVVRDLSSREAEIASEVFPLSIVMDYSETMNWQLDYLRSGPGSQEDRLKRWTEFNAAVISAFMQYQVPTIQLVKSTPKEAVCQVFEKVNTGGVALTVFELLTATYAADDFNLREDWKERKARFSAHSVLDRFRETDFLQVVTLLSTMDRRDRYLTESADGVAPAVSCKRRDILRLPLAEYERWAQIATDAVEQLVPFLHGECIYTGADVPYATQVVPLAAIHGVLGREASSYGVREHLRRWLWCGVFGEMYGGSTETRFAFDVPDVVSWVRGGDTEPRTIQEAQFQASRLVSLRSRNSAAYKGLYAMQMKRGGRDFRTGTPIDIHAHANDAIDIHHVFPKAWGEKNAMDRVLIDSVVNKTAIDAYTNGRIGGRAPSAYLRSLEEKEGIPQADMDAILRSHDLDPASMRADDFPTFFTYRFDRLLNQIEEAMGKPVNRALDGRDNPYAESSAATVSLKDEILALAAGGETKTAEFKSTARCNLHTDAKDVAIEWSTLKSIAGFANSYGGTLLVGIQDDGLVIGIERDLKFVQKQDLDGWLLWLNTAVSTSMGKVVAAGLDVRHCLIDERTVVRIDISPSPKPVFATNPKDSKPAFMVRMTNSTQELVGQDALVMTLG